MMNISIKFSFTLIMQKWFAYANLVKIVIHNELKSPQNRYLIFDYLARETQWNSNNRSLKVTSPLGIDKTINNAMPFALW